MVSAMMVNIANADLIEKMLPKGDYSNIFNQMLNRFSRLIFGYEGTITKLWEHTILSFFGAPLTHEDDPVRAVHAAAAILKEINEINKNDEAQHISEPLQLKVVINTGPVLIGAIKSNLRYEFQSLNSTIECIDYATQLPIPHDRIILFEDTYRFIQRYVECEPIKEVFCEEIQENLKLWQVIQVTQPSIMFKKLPDIRSTSLIGRQNELDQLLELSETVMAGLGRIGLITGEPGIGKSRLIAEWKHHIKMMPESGQLKWIEAQGLAAGQELAYHLLKSLLRAALNITETTPITKVDEIIDTAIMKIPKNEKHSLKLFINHLLDLSISDEDEDQVHRLSAQELRGKYMHCLWQLFRILSLEQPVIILLEDLHWADASSVNILTDLLSLTLSHPILVCLVSRNDRESLGWTLITAARNQFGSRLTRIELDKLSDDESRAMVRSLMDTEEVPEQLLSMVIAKSEGNPYFIEELIRMLTNDGVLTRKNDQWILTDEIESNKIPNSLQGLLSARIDRLPPEARLTLRIASVIGRSFPEKVLQHVMANHAPDIDLKQQLSSLETIGMIRITSVKPELEYGFQHIMLHDAAYHSIVEADLINLHLSVGKALEQFYPDQKERLASQLAHHFFVARDQEKAYTYLDLAGHVAIESYAAAEAEDYFSKAAGLTDDTAKLAHLYTDLGEAFAQQSKHRNAIHAWKNAIYYLNEIKNYDQLARVYAWSARSAWRGYDVKKSLQICLEGLKAVKGAEESQDIAYLIHETGRAFLFNNQTDQAQVYAEQALEMAKRQDAYEVQAESLATIGILPSINTKKAVAALEMAIKISETNNLFGPGSRAYINLAAVIDQLGEVRQARDYRIRALELGSKVGGVADERLISQAITRASITLGEFEDAAHRIKVMKQKYQSLDVYLDENTLDLLFIEGRFSQFIGDFSDAINHFNDVINRSKQVNDVDRVQQGNISLAEVIFEPLLIEYQQENQADLNIVLGILHEVFKTENGPESKRGVFAQCLLSDVYALQGNFEKAKQAITNASTIYHEQPVLRDRFRIVLSQARYEAADRQFDQAIKYFNEALSIAEQKQLRWWRSHIWLEMGNLHLVRNDPEDIDQAQNYYREALNEFRTMGVNYYPDILIEKLRQVKNISRKQAIAHHRVNLELAEAGRVQHTFIPTHSPDIEGYDLSGILLPAHDTSGDFYDFIELENGNLGLVIADVGDKGAGAALYMAMSRTLIRTYASEYQDDPGKVLFEVNRRLLADTQHGIYLTFVFGVLDPANHTFSYVNAGHNPPYWIRQSQSALEITPLNPSGPLAGIFPESIWEVKKIDLAPGDVLVMYTDGITEAINPQDQFYGEDQLLKSLEAGFNPESEIYQQSILEDVHSFTEGAPRLDDITLIILSRDKPEV